MPYSYFTIQTKAAGQYREKGSRFLSFAYPVRKLADIEHQLGALRREYFDARHHCYAWMLGADQSSFRKYDDGEPSHSAGDPILGQIKAKGLTNVLVVVVRYFGGVKLGVGGLMAAYKTAAKDALDAAAVVEEEVWQRYVLNYEYIHTTEVMKLLAALQVEIVRQEFTSACQLEVRVRKRDEASFEEKIRLLETLNDNFRAATLPAKMENE